VSNQEKYRNRLFEKFVLIHEVCAGPESPSKCDSCKVKMKCIANFDWYAGQIDLEYQNTYALYTQAVRNFTLLGQI